MGDMLECQMLGSMLACEIASFSERRLGSAVRLVWTGRHHTKEENIHSGFLIFPFLIDYHLWQEGDTPRSCLTFKGRVIIDSSFIYMNELWSIKGILHKKRGPRLATRLLRDPGIFSKSRSRDSQKSNPGIFWDFQKPLNDCIPRLSTTWIDHNRFFWDL